MINLYERPIKNSWIANQVEALDQDSLKEYNDSFYKYKGYFIDKNDVTINKTISKKRGKK